MKDDIPSPPALHCPTCDYNLTGLPENRCPECGNEFDPKALAAFAADWPPIRLREILVRLILLPVAIIFLAIGFHGIDRLRPSEAVTGVAGIIAALSLVALFATMMWNVIAMAQRIVVNSSRLRRIADRKWTLQFCLAITLLLVYLTIGCGTLAILRAMKMQLL